LPVPEPAKTKVGLIRTIKKTLDREINYLRPRAESWTRRHAGSKGVLVQSRVLRKHQAALGASEMKQQEPIADY